jgi:hypothetical protein
MNTSVIFSLGNAIILIGWLLLIILPKYKHTQNIINYGLVLVFCIAYAALIFSGMSIFNTESFSTLANVKILFQNDELLTAGWFHYLAFDLFVGAFIVHKMQEGAAPMWMRFVILPFTFMFGPLGYLLFCASKLLKKY